MHVLDRLEEASARGVGLELDSEEVEFVRGLSAVVGRLEAALAGKRRGLAANRKERFLVTGLDRQSSEYRVELHIRKDVLLAEIAMLEGIL